MRIRTGVGEDDDGTIHIGETDLEWKCYQCKESLDPECDICGGRRFVATQEGDLLIKFLARHMVLADFPHGPRR